MTLTVRRWLEVLQLDKYATNFEQSGYNDITRCTFLTEDILINLGIYDKNHRHRILTHLPSQLILMESVNENSSKQTGRPLPKHSYVNVPQSIATMQPEPNQIKCTPPLNFGGGQTTFTEEYELPVPQPCHKNEPYVNVSSSSSQSESVSGNITYANSENNYNTNMNEDEELVYGNIAFIQLETKPVPKPRLARSTPKVPVPQPRASKMRQQSLSTEEECKSNMSNNSSVVVSSASVTMAPDSVSVIVKSSVIKFPDSILKSESGQTFESDLFMKSDNFANSLDGPNFIQNSNADTFISSPYSDTLNTQRNLVLPLSDSESLNNCPKISSQQSCSSDNSGKKILLPSSDFDSLTLFDPIQIISEVPSHKSFDNFFETDDLMSDNFLTPKVEYKYVTKPNHLATLGNSGFDNNGNVIPNIEATSPSRNNANEVLAMSEPNVLLLGFQLVELKDNSSNELDDNFKNEWVSHENIKQNFPQNTELESNKDDDDSDYGALWMMGTNESSNSTPQGNSGTTQTEPENDSDDDIDGNIYQVPPPSRPPPPLPQEYLAKNDTATTSSMPLDSLPTVPQRKPKSVVMSEAGLHQKHNSSDDSVKTELESTKQKAVLSSQSLREPRSNIDKIPQSNLSLSGMQQNVSPSMVVNRALPSLPQSAEQSELPIYSQSKSASVSATSQGKPSVAPKISPKPLLLKQPSMPSDVSSEQNQTNDVNSLNRTPSGNTGKPAVPIKRDISIKVQRDKLEEQFSAPVLKPKMPGAKRVLPVEPLSLKKEPAGQNTSNLERKDSALSGKGALSSPGMGSPNEYAYARACPGADDAYDEVHVADQKINEPVKVTVDIPQKNRLQTPPSKSLPLPAKPKRSIMNKVPGLEEKSLAEENSYSEYEFSSELHRPRLPMPDEQNARDRMFRGQQNSGEYYDGSFLEGKIVNLHLKYYIVAMLKGLMFVLRIK